MRTLEQYLTKVGFSEMKDNFKKIIYIIPMSIFICSLIITFMGIFALTQDLLTSYGKIGASNFDTIIWFCFFIISSFWVGIKINDIGGNNGRR